MLGTRTRNLFVCLTASVTAAAATVVAQTPALNVKLGLWEITSTGQSSGAPPFDTSKMTPEQRARVEAVMKARGGAISQPPRATRTCITKEKLANNGFQEGDADSSCKRTLVTNTATALEMKIECGGERPRTTQARFDASSPDNVKGNVKVTITGSSGQSVIDVGLVGKWLGASCGDVK
jgi:hypothetical protein